MNFLSLYLDCNVWSTYNSFGGKNRFEGFPTQYEYGDGILKHFGGKGRVKKTIESVIMIIPCWNPSPSFLKTLIALGYFFCVVFL